MKWKSVVMAAVLVGSLAIQPVPVVAQASDGDVQTEGFGSEKFWDYAMCGASLVLASGTGAWVVAVITCGRAVTQHWAE